MKVRKFKCSECELDSKRKTTLKTKVNTCTLCISKFAKRLSDDPKLKESIRAKILELTR